MLKKLCYFSLLGLFMVSCSGRKPKPNMPAEERLEYAMKKFNKGDYLDAKTEFRIIILNFPGQNIIDKAQYYLAECHYQLKEYILAIAEYEKLVRMFPNSTYIDDAMFKVGLSNYTLSPKYALDQEYTLKAIEELQKFTEDFPKSEYVDQATVLIEKCRDKLARKEYKSAELYRKMTDYEAAIIYFESVLSTYYDTEYAEDAQYWLAVCLQKDRQFERALAEFDRYLMKYPDSNRKETIKKSIKQIEQNKNSISKVDSSQAETNLMTH